MKLRTWRKKQRLSLTELKASLPKNVRVSISTLSRIELGQIARPDPDLCRHLEVLTKKKVKFVDLVP